MTITSFELSYVFAMSEGWVHSYVCHFHH